MFESQTLEDIYKILADDKLAKSDEDILIQYPNSTAEMQVPANTTITTVNRRINKKLKSITVSIPETGIMIVTNNNINRLFFSNESGTLDFPNGLFMEDMTISLTNSGSSPARFNYRMIFSTE